MQANLKKKKNTPKNIERERERERDRERENERNNFFVRENYAKNGRENEKFIVRCCEYKETK